MRGVRAVGAPTTSSGRPERGIVDAQLNSARGKHPATTTEDSTGEGATRAGVGDYSVEKAEVS